MRNIQKEIQDSLDMIEQKHDVRILLAVESGSRAWGFASPDSDYDVRFVFLRRMQDYLRISPLPDVIEWQLDEVLDINGWDLMKVLKQADKGNPSVFEWTLSPIVYRTAPQWDNIRETILACFNPKAAFAHYAGLAEATRRKYLQEKQVKYKKYFYALRPLLCGLWIERYHTVPPVRFTDLLVLFDGCDEMLDERLYEAIQDLLVKKAVTLETDLNPQIPVIQNFIESACPRLKATAVKANNNRQAQKDALDAAFLKALNL